MLQIDEVNDVVRAGLGLAPWDVLHCGVTLHLPLTIGQVLVGDGFEVGEPGPFVLPVDRSQERAALATLGTPRNVTAQEIRVECFFPADEATAKIVRAWSA